MRHHTESDTTAGPPVEPTTGTHTFVHDWRSDDPLWLRIVDALESIPGTDTPESPFLFDALDPEVFDALFAPVGDGRSRSAGVLVVPIVGTVVTVWANGTVQMGHTEETHVG